MTLIPLEDTLQSRHLGSASLTLVIDLILLRYFGSLLSLDIDLTLPVQISRLRSASLTLIIDLMQIYVLDVPMIGSN